jgi:hypothetical protein
MNALSRAAHPLPVTLDEITPAWMTEALRTRAPGVTVKDLGVVDMIRGTCTKVRYRLEMDEAGRQAGIPETVMLKGGFEAHSPDWYDMHEKEVRWYRDVLPVLPIRAPACYFADCDPARPQGLVVMEDLARRGVSFCSGLRPHGFEAVARRLSALADYHARTWASDELEAGGRWEWVEPIMPKAAASLDAKFPDDVWKSYVGSPRGAAVSVRFHDRAWLRGALAKLTVFSQGLPHAILHADTHPGNLYVEADGTPGFFDSLPHRAPPMLELAYHMTCAIDTADRRRWEGALIQHYLGELARHGVAAPGFDDAYRQFGLFLAYAYFVFIINASIFQPEAVNTAYTARISAAMLDHDTMGMLERLG